ncbi:hypothetical protein PVAP13_5NG220581 [Panicum virgatum]|uniref:Uncharacterized protein n=1 Tax=Panicum virgatum TaxID=38727 RepID=A0A8T0RQS9_PANVG|nr:hypothetical protein PVAP13_5NG220581 [Panicum virgatum]
MTSSLCGRGELPLRSAERGGPARAARGLRTLLVGMARRPPFLRQLFPSLPTPARPPPPPPALPPLPRAIEGANCHVRSGFGVPRRIWLTEGWLESCRMSLNRRRSND